MCHTSQTSFFKTCTGYFCLENWNIIYFNYYAIENLYPAFVAGQSCSITESEKGIMIRINGFSAKIHVVIDEVTRGIKNIVENAEESVFNLMKAEGKKKNFNLLMKGTSIIDDFLDLILEEKFTSFYERYLTFDNLKFEDFQKFSGKFLKNLKIQMLAQGNITKKQSIEFAEQIQSNLNCNAIEDVSLDIDFDILFNFIHYFRNQLYNVESVSFHQKQII